VIEPWRIDVERVLAIDPGAVHCGVAMWIDAECIWGNEYDPTSLYENLAFWLETKSVDTVVIEMFQLYPWMAEEQGWSQMETCEVIGVLKYICWAWDYEPVMQPASIKKPTFAILRRKKIKAYGKTPKNQHILDAQAHGWYYIFNKKD
jgi:hypothetical protein